MSDSNDNSSRRKNPPRGGQPKTAPCPLGHLRQAVRPRLAAGRDHPRWWFARWQPLHRGDWWLRAALAAAADDDFRRADALGHRLRDALHRRETVSRDQQTHQPGARLGLAHRRDAGQPRVGHAAVLARHGRHSAKLRHSRGRQRQVLVRAAALCHRCGGGVVVRQRQ